MDASGNGRVGDNGTVRKPNGKREKYATRACSSCKRRKVKCSGEDACRECRSRDMVCRYSLPPGSISENRDASARLPDAGAGPTSPVGVLQHVHPAGRSAVCPDPRVDGLCDRVRALEQTIGLLLKPGKGSENLSRDQHLGLAIQPVNLIEEDDDVANQFMVGTSRSDDVTLSSQVAAISALLSRPPSPRPFVARSNSKAGQLIEFPEPHTLQHLMDVYFHDFDGYFPFLDRPTVESRIQGTLRRYGYSSYNCTLLIPVDELPTVALACIMLAMAECLDSSEGGDDGETKPGWSRYVQYRRAVQRFSDTRPLPLDMISAQVLAAAYLMHCEALGPASSAITTVWHLATSARLHNQKVWSSEDPKDTIQKRKLWWTIYFLDRQISRRSGFAYHIRDIEFEVEDFAANDETSANGSKLRDKLPRSVDGDYMQALINLARLWGNVWDTFFAVGRLKKGDWMEVEIMDARILNTRRQLPSTLTWESSELANYASAGEGEPQIRRRIQIYTRLDLLRLLIRQNPVCQAVFAPETAHMCSRLSRGIINSYDLLISQHPNARATGYFATSSIVECIYHLAPVLQYSQDSQEHAACVSAFHQAHGILVRLSPHNKVAEKALKALNGLIKKWSSGSASTDEESARRASNAIDNFTFAPGQIYMSNVNDGQLGADGVGLDLGEWMDMSLGPLFSNDFNNEIDFRLGA